MICRCPNCGAANSLDSLVGDAEAAEVLKMLLELDADIGKAAIRYIGLFRPGKSQLSWGRTAKLLKELLPQIQTATIERNGTTYAAPMEAWLYSFQEILVAREAGRLKHCFGAKRGGKAKPRLKPGSGVSIRRKRRNADGRRGRFSE